MFRIFTENLLLVTRLDSCQKKIKYLNLGFATRMFMKWRTSRSVRARSWRREGVNKKRLIITNMSAYSKNKFFCGHRKKVFLYYFPICISIHSEISATIRIIFVLTPSLRPATSTTTTAMTNPINPTGNSFILPDFQKCEKKSLF